MARIIITRQPFAAVISINITGTREMQLYNIGTGVYAPDRRLTPTVLEPCIRIVDHSALLNSEAILTRLGSNIKQVYDACSTEQEKEDYLARQMLTGIKWFVNNTEITPSYRDLQVNESEGSKTRGNLRVSRNNLPDQTEPLVFRFEGVLTDPVTKRSAKVTGERVLRLTTEQRGELTAVIEEEKQKPFHLYKRPDGAFSSLRLFGRLYKDGLSLPTLSLFRFSVQAGTKADCLYGVSLWGGEGGATCASSCLLSVDALIARTFAPGGKTFNGGTYLLAEALCMPLFLFIEDKDLKQAYNNAYKQQGKATGTFNEWLFARMTADSNSGFSTMFGNANYDQWFGGSAGMTAEERVARCPKAQQRIDLTQSPWQAKLTIKEGTYASGDCPVSANSTIHISVDVSQFGATNSVTTKELFTVKFGKLIRVESVPGVLHEVNVAQLLDANAEPTAMQSATLPVATLTDRVTGLSYRVE